MKHFVIILKMHSLVEESQNAAALEMKNYWMRLIHLTHHARLRRGNSTLQHNKCPHLINTLNLQY